jgi:alpha-galactosidase
MEKERAIAEEAGYYRGIGERVSCYYGGIGAYHQIAFLEELTKDIEEICPDAWLIQTSNPVFEGTNFITRNFRIKTVGVCHGHSHYTEIVDELGIDPGKVNVEIIGFNHWNWLTRFYYEGKDAYPLLDEWIKTRAPEYWKTEHFPEQLSPGAIEAYRIYGVMPIGDAVRAATPWWTHTDHETKCKWYGKKGGFDSKTGWDEYLASKVEIQNSLVDIMKSGKSIMEALPPSETTEEHIPFIDSIANGVERKLTLNVPNNGAIPGIPNDILVEVPVICNAAGLHNVQAEALPSRLMNNIFLPRLGTALNIINAYENHDREELVLWLCKDPRTRSYEQAKDLIDKLLAQPWNKDAEAHYR